MQEVAVVGLALAIVFKSMASTLQASRSCAQAASAQPGSYFLRGLVALSGRE